MTAIPKLTPNEYALLLRAESAEYKIARLREALEHFVAACDTAPPTSLMNELGIACKAAKAVLMRYH